MATTDLGPNRIRRTGRLAALTSLTCRNASSLDSDPPYVPRAVTIQKVGKSVVDVDLNLPMAGKDLHFAIEIVDVREASAEEIEHGHVHGDGGHHH